MLSFKEFISINEMAKVNLNTNRNYEAMSSEAEWNERKEKSTLVKDMGDEKLYKLIAKNSNMIYILTDKNDSYIADIEIDSSNDDTINNKKGIWIDAGYSKVRGAYAKLLSALLKHTNASFIMSDTSLSDRAAKFWSKFVDAIETSSYKKVLYNANTKELIPYDKSKAFNYGDNQENNDWHIGIIK